MRSAGVEPGGEDAEQPDAHEPPGRGRSEDQADQRGGTERRERSGLHGAGSGGAAADEAQRTDPVLVGAADAVGVVVGVVHPDLQEQRDEQSERGLPPHRLVHPQRDRGPGQHRGYRSRQRPGSRPRDPLVDRRRGGGHGRDCVSGGGWWFPTVPWETVTSRALQSTGSDGFAREAGANGVAVSLGPQRNRHFPHVATVGKWQVRWGSDGVSSYAGRSRLAWRP